MNQFSPELLQQSLEALLQNSGADLTDLSFVVGLSGGVDSLVLLHALSSLVSLEASSDVPPNALAKPSRFHFKLTAIHVNHQLQSQANDWQSFCISFCKKHQIPLQCVAVDARPTQGEGPEAAARKARYAAFKKHLHDDDVLLTGHHLDDQIETVFLQLLRGTGIDGAAGMRQVSTFDSHHQSTYLVRPLLTFSREQVEVYANKHNMQWVDDPSNHQTHYDRNFLRHDILPVIENRWPAYRQTINRFTQNMREASELLKEISVQDFSVVYNDEENAIEITELARFSSPRVNNVLRHWIGVEGFSLPGEKQLCQIKAAIVAKADANPVVRWGKAEVRRFKNKLYIMPQSLDEIDKKTIITLSNWQQGQPVSVPGYGTLELQVSKTGGIKASCFSSDNIQIKFRQGGEKCQPVGRDKSQSLKKVFQEKNIPPWCRDNTPLVFINDEIAAVVDAFYCTPFAACDEEGLIVVQVNKLDD